MCVRELPRTEFPKGLERFFFLYTSKKKNNKNLPRSRVRKNFFIRGGPLEGGMNFLGRPEKDV